MVNVPWSWLEPADVARLHAAGLLVAGGTADTAADIATCVRLGLDAVNSNDPGACGRRARPPGAAGLTPVRLTDRILLIGSGEPDWAPTDPLDSQVYLVETADGHVVIDAGAGPACRRWSRRRPTRRRRPGAHRLVLLTHGHARPRRRRGARGGESVPGHPDRRVADGRRWLARRADETATSVDRARAAGIYPDDLPARGVRAGRGARAGGRPVTVGDVVLRGRRPRRATPPATSPSSPRSTASARLFSGDALFPQGRILLQDTWDCDLHDALRSVERLAGLGAERLLAGHLGPVLVDAPVHLAAAMDRIGRLLVPESLS